MTANTDTGISDSDNITNKTTPTFVGTAEPGSTVSLYNRTDDGGRVLLGTATANASGIYFIVPSSALAAGPYTLFVEAVDVAGNSHESASVLKAVIGKQLMTRLVNILKLCVVLLRLSDCLTD